MSACLIVQIIVKRYVGWGFKDTTANCPLIECILKNDVISGFWGTKIMLFHDKKTKQQQQQQKMR